MHSTKQKKVVGQGRRKEEIKPLWINNAQLRRGVARAEVHAGHVAKLSVRCAVARAMKKKTQPRRASGPRWMVMDKGALKTRDACMIQMQAMHTSGAV